MPQQCGKLTAWYLQAGQGQLLAQCTITIPTAGYLSARCPACLMTLFECCDLLHHWCTLCACMCCSATVVLLPDPELGQALEKEEQDKLAAKRGSLGPKEVGRGGDYCIHACYIAHLSQA
jgi:hypothetical protein